MQFLHKSGIVGQFELPKAMRKKAMGFPDRLHRRSRNIGHKALLPSPYASLRLASRGHDLMGAVPGGRQDDDTCPPNMFCGDFGLLMIRSSRF